MGSSFREDDLFGSGPHEFVVGRQGLRIVSFSVIADDPSVPGTGGFGDLELRITVRGRLVGSSVSSVWSDYDDILSQADLALVGTLSDGEGRSWDSMTLLTVEADGPIKHGRDVSLGYTVVFGRLAS